MPRISSAAHGVSGHAPVEERGSAGHAVPRRPQNTPIVTSSTPDRPMNVVVPVRSVTDKKLTLHYQFIFMDDRGRPLRPMGGWQYITVEPKLQIFMEGSALNTAATDYRLEIRPNR